MYYTFGMILFITRPYECLFVRMRTSGGGVSFVWLRSEQTLPVVNYRLWCITRYNYVCASMIYLMKLHSGALKKQNDLRVSKRYHLSHASPDERRSRYRVRIYDELRGSRRPAQAFRRIPFAYGTRVPSVPAACEQPHRRRAPDENVEKHRGSLGE